MYIKSFNFDFYSHHFRLHIWGHSFSTDMSIRQISSHWNPTLFPLFKIKCNMYARALCQPGIRLKSFWMIQVSFSKYNALLHLTKMPEKPFPQRVSHGEVFTNHLTRHLTKHLTNRVMGVGWWVLMDGGAFGEGYGEVIQKHLTIRKADKQWDSELFGEMLTCFPTKHNQWTLHYSRR